MGLMFLGLSLPPAVRLVEPSVSATAPAASALWLAPTTTPSSRSALAIAIDKLSDGQATVALPALMRATADPELGGYARLYVGRAQLALGRVDEADATARKLLATPPKGYLGDAALSLAAQVAEVQSDWPAAIRALRLLERSKPIDPAQVSLRMGRAALKSGDLYTAMAAFSKTYYEFPLSSEAADAGVELTRLAAPGTRPNRETFQADLDRAETLYAGKRYTDARTLLLALRPVATADERGRVDLRLGATEYALKHYAAARDLLRPLADADSDQQLDAQFFYFSTLRELGRQDEYVAMARAFANGHPTHPLAEEALNNLGTHYTLVDDDEQAAAVLAELYARYPNGVRADRAAWRSGWWAFKNGRFRETIATFESSVPSFAL